MYAKGKGAVVPSDNQAREKLALYVYEYLLHVGAQKSAQTFLSEIRWEKNITLGEPPGFLHSWWWENCEHSSEAKAFHDYPFMSPRFPGGPRPSLRMPNQNYGGMRPPPNSMGGPMPGMNMGPGGRGPWPGPNANSIQYSSSSPGHYVGPPGGGGPPGTPIMPSPGDSNNSSENIYTMMNPIGPGGNRPNNSPNNMGGMSNPPGTPRDDGEMGGNFLNPFQSESYSPNMTMSASRTVLGHAGPLVKLELPDAVCGIDRKQRHRKSLLSDPAPCLSDFLSGSGQ
ncbi:unnamed protein product [Coregonus sp. 'balchen']|nr:unnamed protein product [Coregonus sp. 'balchen']